PRRPHPDDRLRRQLPRRRGDQLPHLTHCSPVAATETACGVCRRTPQEVRRPGVKEVSLLLRNSWITSWPPELLISCDPWAASTNGSQAAPALTPSAASSA